MRILAIIQRIFLQLIRDKRTMALLFIAPLFLLTLMYLIFQEDSQSLRLGMVDVPASVVEKITDAKITVQVFDAYTATMLEDEDLDGCLSFVNEEMRLVLRNDDPSVAKQLRMKVEQIYGTVQVSEATQMQIKTLLKNTNTSDFSLHMETEALQVDYFYGDENRTFFDRISPTLLSFFVFFFVFLIAGIGLLRERTTGTLERLLSTPIRRYEIVLGYFIGYGILALIQTILVIIFAVGVLDVVMVGSIGAVIFVNVIVAFVALSLGILLSSFASSEFQIMQFIPIVIVPQIFFSGLFPLEGMASWVQGLSKIMPLYYAAEAQTGLMYKGLSLSEVIGPVIVLSCIALMFVLLNIIVLKRYRRL